MKQFTSYPVIRTSKFPQTVGFYEDMFSLVPFYEAQGYIRLRHKDSEDVALTIINADHPYIPVSLQGDASSQMFSFAVADFDAVYDTIYMEGLDILKSPTDLGEGVRHFMFADPYNDVVINIMNQATTALDDKFHNRSPGAGIKSSGQQSCAAC